MKVVFAEIKFHCVFEGDFERPHCWKLNKWSQNVPKYNGFEVIKKIF